MKNKLTNNLGLKLASVFFAVIIWLVVNSINNPTINDVYYNIPVKLLNTELITDSGQVYEVLDNTDVISRVTVWAPRSVISELDEENIVATADVSELSSLDTISIKLTTNISSGDISRISGSIDTVKLNIEDKGSKALALKATVSGKVPKGYLVGDITTDQNLIRISGPQSVIDQIAKAAVDVDVTGMTSDIVTNADIKFYDEDDNQIDTRNISQNIKSVGVEINIWQTAEVPLSYSVMGKAASGYRDTGVIEGEGQTVVVAGKSNTIKNITSIDVPAEALDITDQSENYTVDLDIRKYLPEGVFLASSGDAIQTVTVYIERETSKKLEIRAEKVKITNLPEGYDASISGLDSSFIIELIGLPQDMAAVQANSVNGVVDIVEWMNQHEMTEPMPGYYTVEVDFGLPDRVSLLEPVTVTLHISKVEEE
ncbi:MAG: CdaR family protein [Lachnospiraceae bacterium]|nr:CdaR family protein [Lachnospiraceae bacterium]